MTPLENAQRLARSEDRADVLRGVAILVRGLTDDDPSDPLRMPWPMTNEVIERAAEYLGVEITAEERRAIFALAPTLSDAILNRGAR